MQPARIAELLQPFLSPILSSCHSDRSWSASDGVVEESAILSPSQLIYISTYIDILQRWNARINLTAIRNEEEIVTRHFGESLFAARHLFPRVASVPSVVKDFDLAEAGSRKPEARVFANDQRPTTNDRVADLGSGAGFPGIPIKLWAPEIHLTLIESNHKKATFLREVTRALTLTNVNIQERRAEQLTQGAAGFDLITMRAVEHFARILPVAASLLAPGGRLALLLGSSQLDQARSLPNMSWAEPTPVPQSRSRVLLIGQLP
jgi:16S rRNA (guanine527-N7)-methyltransferase